MKRRKALDETLSRVREASHKRSVVRFYLYEVPRTGKFIETKSQVVVTRVWGRRGGELVFGGFRASIYSDENVLEIVVVVE